MNRGVFAIVYNNDRELSVQWLSRAINSINTCHGPIGNRSLSLRQSQLTRDTKLYVEFCRICVVDEESYF